MSADTEGNRFQRSRTISAIRKINQKGLSLIEVIVTIAVLGVVSALTLPIIGAKVTLISLEANNRSLTEIHNFIRDWDKADGTILYENGRLQSYYQGMKVENISFPDGYILVGDGSLANPYALSSNYYNIPVVTVPEPTPTPTATTAPVADPTPTPTATTTAAPAVEPTPTPTPTATTTPVAEPVLTVTQPAIVPDGTLQQPSTVTSTSGAIGTGLTYVRDATKVVLNSNSANWNQIRVTYTVSSTQTVDLLKKTANGTTVSNVLRKISNTQVEILLPEGQPFTLVVTYNGGSSGYFFFT